MASPHTYVTAVQISSLSLRHGHTSSRRPYDVPPPQAQLWRYMDFTKYVSLLSSRALFISAVPIILKICTKEPKGTSGERKRGTSTTWNSSDRRFVTHLKGMNVIYLVKRSN